MSDGVHWVARVGGTMLLWPDDLAFRDFAKMLRLSKVKAQLRYDTTPGRRHEKVAQLLAQAALGRVVPLEDIDLHPASARELAYYRGLTPGPPGEQLTLL